MCRRCERISWARLKIEACIIPVFAGAQGDFRQNDARGQRAMQVAVGFEFCVGTSQLDSERVGLLPLALPAVVSSCSVTLDALDATLLLLVVRLGTLTRWEGGGGLR